MAPGACIATERLAITTAPIMRATPPTSYGRVRHSPTSRRNRDPRPPPQHGSRMSQDTESAPSTPDSPTLRDAETVREFLWAHCAASPECQVPHAALERILAERDEARAALAELKDTVGYAAIETVRAALREAQEDTARLRHAVSLLVEKYGRGQKSGRADYTVLIPCVTSSTCYAPPFRRNFMTALQDDTARLDDIEWFGCMTGDCPHILSQAECDAAILGVVRSVIAERRSARHGGEFDVLHLTPRPRRTCRTPYLGGTCGCGCGCDENPGRPEDGTCDCSECRPGQVVEKAKCAECANEMHKVIDKKGGFVCSSLRCARYGVRQ